MQLKLTLHPYCLFPSAKDSLILMEPFFGFGKSSENFYYILISLAISKLTPTTIIVQIFGDIAILFETVGRA
jgi:hypothetical protein